MLELLLTNATILDGSGAEPFLGHVGIEGETISGPWRGIPPGAVQVIDAAGKMFAPGFIDVHSHADLVLLDYEHLADASSFRNPRALAEGMEKVLVNGRLVLDQGEYFTEDAGRLLRHP